MERQTLHQQTPIYHVCQHCGGEGCAACSDLLILDGDIQLDPEWSDELPAVAPINGFIGVSTADKSGSVCAKCGKSRFDSAYGCLAPQVYSPASGDWVCCKSGSNLGGNNGSPDSIPLFRFSSESPSDFDSNRHGHCQAHVRQGQIAPPSSKPAPKYDISFDDRNMYQRREDDLRLAGEWEV